MGLSLTSFLFHRALVLFPFAGYVVCVGVGGIVFRVFIVADTGSRKSCYEDRRPFGREGLRRRWIPGEIQTGIFLTFFFLCSCWFFLRVFFFYHVLNRKSAESDSSRDMIDEPRQTQSKSK